MKSIWNYILHGGKLRHVTNRAFSIRYLRNQVLNELCLCVVLHFYSKIISVCVNFPSLNKFFRIFWIFDWCFLITIKTCSSLQATLFCCLPCHFEYPFHGIQRLPGISIFIQSSVVHILWFQFPSWCQWWCRHFYWLVGFDVYYSIWFKVASIKKKG